MVGKDVAAALGYTAVEKAIRTHVDEDDKGVTEMDTPGGKQKMVIINESGLYSLVLSSKLPGAMCPLCGFTHEDFPCSITVRDLEQAGTAKIELVDDVPGAVIEPEEIPEEDYGGFEL
nr:MAG TPA: BRO family protein [Caudoviricetes sp.]